MKNLMYKSPKKSIGASNRFRSYTVKTGVSLQQLLRHRNSASASVISALTSVCLRVKTTLLGVKTILLSVKPTLSLFYRVEMTLLSALIKSHSKVLKRHSNLKVSFPTLDWINGV
jgi:hypothetical protein